MKLILYSGIFIMYFGSAVLLTPQELRKPTEKAPLKVIEVKPKVDYDSILQKAKDDAEKIKENEAIVKKNDGYINNLTKKKEKLVQAIHTDLEKLSEKKTKVDDDDVIVILKVDTVRETKVFRLDSVCLEKRSWVGRTFAGREYCKQYRVDSIWIKTEINE